MSVGDLVVDLDELLAALSLQPVHTDVPSVLQFAWEARDAIIERMSRDSQCRRAWIIDATADSKRFSEYKRLHADIIVLDTPLDVCIERLSTRPEASRLQQAARDWHAQAAQSKAVAQRV